MQGGDARRREKEEYGVANDVRELVGLEFDAGCVDNLCGQAWPAVLRGALGEVRKHWLAEVAAEDLQGGPLGGRDGFVDYGRDDAGAAAEIEDIEGAG